MGIKDFFGITGRVIKGEIEQTGDFPTLKDRWEYESLPEVMNDHRRESTRDWEHDATLNHVKNPITGKWEYVDKY
jgi:hypothetical protein